MIEDRIGFEDRALVAFPSQPVNQRVNSGVAGSAKGDEVAIGVVWCSGLLAKAVDVMNNAHRVLSALLAGAIVSRKNDLAVATHLPVFTGLLSPLLYLGRVVRLVFPSCYTPNNLRASRASLLRTMLECEWRSAIRARNHGAYFDGPVCKSDSLEAFVLPIVVSDRLARLAVFLRTGKLNHTLTTPCAQSRTVSFHGYTKSQDDTLSVTLRGLYV